MPHLLSMDGTQHFQTHMKYFFFFSVLSSAQMSVLSLSALNSWSGFSCYVRTLVPRSMLPLRQRSPVLEVRFYFSILLLPHSHKIDTIRCHSSPFQDFLFLFCPPTPPCTQTFCFVPCFLVLPSSLSGNVKPIKVWLLLNRSLCLFTINYKTQTRC